MKSIAKEKIKLRSNTLLQNKAYNSPLLLEQGRFDAIVTNIQEMNFAALMTDEPHDHEDCDYEVTADGIAVIPIDGVLVKGEVDYCARVFYGLQSYEQIEADVKHAVENSGVKAILLNINSPGGEVNGNFDLADRIYEMRGEKPIWAFANDNMYSGAYSLGSCADKIFVNRTSGIGSIGVITMHVEYSQHNKEAGINYTVIRSGKYKAEHNQVEELTDHAQKTLQAETDRVYDIFTETIARNRGMSVDAVKKSEAGLYFGPDGITAGYADELTINEELYVKLHREISKKDGGVFMSENTQQNQEQKPETESTQAIATPEPIQTSAVADATAHAAAVESAKQQAAADYKSYVHEVQTACKLAGMPDQAFAFIEAETPVSEVKDKLLEMKAFNADNSNIYNAHNPTTSGSQIPVINSAEIYRERNEADQKAAMRQ